jgi:hypothetical protein
MNEFKFLSNKIKQQAYGVFNFMNGETLSIYSESLYYGINRIQYSNINIKNFRWSYNLNASLETQPRDYRQSYRYYSGRIREFFDYYEIRRNFPNDAFLPVTPVIQRIECQGYTFDSGSLVFSDMNQYVRIRYIELL